MERQNLSQILITDTDYYYKNSIYTGFLKRNNITTVEELVNGTFDSRTFNGHMLQKYTASRLRGFITLLKHEYLGEPLLMDAYLDKGINIDRSRGEPFGGCFQFENPTAKEYDVMVSDFFGCDYSYTGPCVANFLREKREERDTRVVNKLEPKKVKVIDFFNWILDRPDEYKKFVPASKMYVEEYKKKYDDTEKNDEQSDLINLRGQLTSLLRRKKALEDQIEIVQKQIDEMCNEDSKGGALK